MRTPRAQRLCTILFLLTSAVTLIGAGYSGFAFTDSPKDQVLLQMVFYGAWTSLVGAWIGGRVGAAIEEDACSSMDMGVLSSMGAFLGAFAAGTIGTAAAGFALDHGWTWLWSVAVALGLAHISSGYAYPLEIQRHPRLGRRGLWEDQDGSVLPVEHQSLRMKERVAVLLALAFVVILGLTLWMAVRMGWNLGHPMMLAPMMYGMSGTMAGGMLGGWLAGVLDEHRGVPEQENSIMVAAMALMAGMMGGMPAGMIGGMMAVMGGSAIVITVAIGTAFAIACWAIMMRGRYAIVRQRRHASVPAMAMAASGAVAMDCTAPDCEVESSMSDETVPEAGDATSSTGGASLRVRGMRCDGCISKILHGVRSLDGVNAAEVDLAAGLVIVRWGSGFRGLLALAQCIRALGYEVM